MKTKTIHELVSEIERQDAAKKDFVVNPSKIDYVEEDKKFKVKIDSSYETLDVADSQISLYTGIPLSYYKKTKAQFPSLLAENVKMWMSLKDEKRMVRTLDGNVRAWLSSSYRRIDYYDVLKILLSFIQNEGKENYNIYQCEVTEKKMYLKIVLENFEKQVKPGDNVKVGILLSNSEVGQGSLSIRPFVLRLVCSNGMVVERYSKKYYHVSKEQKNIFEGMQFDKYSDEIMKMEDNLIVAKAKESLRSAFFQVRNMNFLDHLSRSTTVDIADPLKTVNSVSEKYELLDNEKNRVLSTFVSSKDISLWGLVNAITDTAKHSESYERSLELETIASNVLLDAESL